MKVMVTCNVETDLDVTNGARGVVVGIIMHANKDQYSDQTEVHLERMPKYVLMQLNRTQASTLAGLEKGVIPVEPMEVTFKIKVAGVKADGMVD